MKRETLKDQTNKDGSHTRIEKITQTPEEANRFKMYFIGVVAFLIYGLVQSIISFRKQDQQREKERTKEQREKA